jgi:hypothetical protein
MKKNKEETNLQKGEMIDRFTKLDIGAVKIDPESNQQFVATKDAMLKFDQICARYMISTASQAIDLRTVRDERLYLIVCDSFKEFAEEFLHYSPQYCRRLINFANRFGDSEHFPKIASMDQRFLMAVSKDDELTEQLKSGEFKDAEGNTFSIDQLKEMIGTELQSKVRLLESEKKHWKGEAGKFKSQSEQYKKMSEDLENMPEGARLKAITERNDIKATLAVVRGSFAASINDLNDIETEDPEIIQEYSGIVTGAITALSALQDKYFHHLLSASNKE